jgi:phage shock protein PspC (stress-responsive transcriptional regulator)
MKKTLTVNISGQVFHIDEDAYKVLNDYLQSIRQHFAKTQGGEEIFSDIEARIAEMLRERLGDSRQVVSIEDISQIIKIIGEPEEFGGEEFNDQRKSEGRRDEGKSVKRLYRDSENAMIGGVCAGLAAYFHSDIVWFRLGFAIATIAGFGTPILLYIILWIVVPEARTATERLEMKGERVDISNIGRSVREEIEKLKNKFNDFAQEARGSYKKKSEDYRPDIQRAGHALLNLVEVFVRIILVFIGIVLFIVGTSLVFGFLALVFGFGHQIFFFDTELIFLPIPDLLNLISGQPDSVVFIKTGLILLLGIPIVMILWGGIKLIFGIRKTHFVGVMFFNLWLIGLIICFYFGVKLSKSFRYPGNIGETLKIEMPQDSVINLRLSDNEKLAKIQQSGEVIEIEDIKMVLSKSEENLFYGIPELKIERAENDSIKFQVIKMAKGRNTTDAEDRARRILYTHSNSENSFSFDPFFTLPDKELWRVQQVILILRIPDGTYLNLDANLDELLEEENFEGEKFQGKTWKMTDHGLIRTDIKNL